MSRWKLLRLRNWTISATNLVRGVQQLEIDLRGPCYDQVLKKDITINCLPSSIRLIIEREVKTCPWETWAWGLVPGAFIINPALEWLAVLKFECNRFWPIFSFNFFQKPSLVFLLSMPALNSLLSLQFPLNHPSRKAVEPFLIMVRGRTSQPNKREWDVKRNVSNPRINVRSSHWSIAPSLHQPYMVIKAEHQLQLK